MSSTTFEYIYHHIFLPPHLPAVDDASPKSEASLVDFVHQCLERFLPQRRDEKAVGAGISMMQFLQKSRNPQGHLREVGVREVLQGLQADGEDSDSALRKRAR